ncbi:MAG: lysophospholipid transporter LplT [Betaproteobacteria bacterium]|nr:lysophospholipid transporter LplT [Betaproteobacteria bacterium]
MTSGFYIIMAAQFFSALADSALLIAAIAILRDMQAADAIEPLLKLFFTVSYVALAAFVGAFADSMPKWRVMFISNGIKIIGCAMMFFGIHPLAAYAVVGLGAAAYSPAKYGILTELLPPRLLIAANGWIEGLTVGAIVFGTLIGGVLIEPKVVEHVLDWGIPGVNSRGEVAITIVGLLYLIASTLNLKIPDTGVDHKPLRSNPIYLLHEFTHCVKLLWRDKLGQISLAVTTLFWGAGATLQFIVIKWAETNLNLELSKASMLQGVVAIGVALGSIMAAKLISMRRSVSVIPLGIAMGLGVNLMIFIYDLKLALLLMVVVGALAGFFVVPMNALLQHRGHILMGAGHSIAVQNFNENLSILIMTGLYALLIENDLSIHTVIVLFGCFVAGAMYFVHLRHHANQREFDSVSQLEDLKH